MKKVKKSIKTPVEGVNYTLKKTLQVYETQEYDLFTFDWENNREVETDTKHFENLKASIDRDGLKDPIWVIKKEEDGNISFVIAAGQHRFEACRALGVPVQFIIVEEDDYSLLSRVVWDSYTKKNILKDFIKIGARRGYKIFKLVEQLVEDFDVEFGGKYSAAFETVFTISANRKEKVYKNSQFMYQCKKSPALTNKLLDSFANWPVYEEERGEMYKHTRIVADITTLVRRNKIGVNFNREMLKLLTPSKEVESTPEEILSFLRKEENWRFREELGKVYSGKDSQIRSVLKQIDEKILSPDEIKERRIKRTMKLDRIKKAKSTSGKKEPDKE